MRILSFSLLVFLISCNNSKDNKPVVNPVLPFGEFRLALDSGKWTINIPEGYTVEDSAAYMDRLAHTPYQQPNAGETSGTLLYVYEPGSLADTIHYALSLSKFPWADTASMEYHLKIGTNYMTRTLNLDSTFQYLLSHRLTPDTIDGQPFIVEEYDVLRRGDTVLFRYYNGIRNRQLLQAYLHYYKKDTMGLQLKKAIEASRFE